MENVLDSVYRRIILEMNNSLLQRYTPDEVRRAIFQMHPSKAPGPDGMSHFFSFRNIGKLLDLMLVRQFFQF